MNDVKPTVRENTPDRLWCSVRCAEGWMKDAKDGA